MKRYAILGLGTFGQAILEELLQKRVELIIADRDERKLEDYKQRVMAVYVADLSWQSTLEQILPQSLDGCVVDLGDNTEGSILLTHYLHKMGFRNIMVLGNSRSHSEIVRLLGADVVVDPSTEAARRMVPRLINNGLLSYTPLGRGLSFAEIPLPETLVGKRLIDVRFRQTYGLTVIAVRKDEGRSELPEAAQKSEVSEDDAYYSLDDHLLEQQQYKTPGPDYVFLSGDILLVSGSDEAINSYAQDIHEPKQEKQSKSFMRIFRKKAR